jgi:hypothetical protein
MQKGSLVICIKTNHYPSSRKAPAPTIGDVLTVSDIFTVNNYRDIVLEFVEYGPIFFDGLKMGYNIEYFREIQPPMSIPESLFNQSPEKFTV